MRLARRLLMLGLILPLAVGLAQADPRHDSGGYNDYRKPPATTYRPPPRTPTTDDYRKPRPPVAQDYRKPAPIVPPVARTAPDDDKPVQPRQDYRKPVQPPVARTNPDDDYRKPVVPPVARTNPDDDYRKPVPPVARTAPDQDYRKPVQPVQPSAPATARTAADIAISKGQSGAALRQFDDDQKKFKAPPVAAPVDPQKAKESPVWREYGNRWGTADDYYAARRRAQTQLPPQVTNYFTNPPPQVAAGPSAFGNLSSVFLGAALGSIGTSAWDSWMYGHRRDPDVQEWYRYQQQQAKTDPELQAKMTRLDARMAEMEAQKAPVTDKLPDGVDPSLVVAPQTVMLATTKPGLSIWIWLPLLLLLLAIGFVVLCVWISRNRQRLA